MSNSGKFNLPASAKSSTPEFAQAVEDVTPLPAHERFMHDPVRLPAYPLSRFRDEREVIFESMQDPAGQDINAIGEPEAFVQAGVSRQILRRLRQGDWRIQAELDLHGLTRLEAKVELAEFLHDCRRHGVRCIRIIHGKGLGSVNREPVLRQHVRHWLTQRSEILGFVTARQAEGGSGALIALMRGK